MNFHILAPILYSTLYSLKYLQKYHVELNVRHFLQCLRWGVQGKYYPSPGPQYQDIIGEGQMGR